LALDFLVLAKELVHDILVYLVIFLFSIFIVYLSMMTQVLGVLSFGMRIKISLVLGRFIVDFSYWTRIY
jgi:hypothetical protein